MATPDLASVVCWRWKPAKGYRSTYPPDTVNTLKRMVRRWYPKDVRFLCVTDDPDGIDADVEIVPLWNDYADVPNPHGHPRNPSCYRRLRMFSREIAEVFGERFVSLDLDTVIVGDLRPIWDRPEDIVFWGDTNPRTHYNGSMVLMTAGARPQVWETFDPVRSPRRSMAAGCFGSDQGWISYCLGPGEAKWSTTDGVYSFRNHIAPNMQKLPESARVTFWHGHIDPWSPYAQQIAWVREYYK